MRASSATCCSRRASCAALLLLLAPKTRLWSKPCASRLIARASKHHSSRLRAHGRDHRRSNSRRGRARLPSSCRFRRLNRGRLEFWAMYPTRTQQANLDHRRSRSISSEACQFETQARKTARLLLSVKLATKRYEAIRARETAALRRQNLMGVQHRGQRRRTRGERKLSRGKHRETFSIR